MKNLTVRSSLIGVLLSFAMMLVIGAMAGLFTLGRANDSQQLFSQISSQTVLINDAYKNAMRIRVVLLAAYAALKEKNDTIARDKILARGHCRYFSTIDVVMLRTKSSKSIHTANF